MAHVFLITNFVNKICVGVIGLSLKMSEKDSVPDSSIIKAFPSNVTEDLQKCGLMSNFAAIIGGSVVATI